VVCGDRDEGVVVAVERGDTVELRLRKLNRRDRFTANQCGEFADGFC